MRNSISLAGRKLRVEFNWNALANYCKLSGMNDLADLDKIVNITAGDMRAFIYVAVVEGERMDGREFELSEEDLGAIMRPADISEIMKIYAEQTKVTGGQTPSPATPVKKKGLFRLKK